MSAAIVPDHTRLVAQRPDAVMPAVSMRGLRRRFGAKVALEDVTFDARRGAVTGFLGPNGAGKTTAIRILLGLDRADDGAALVLGRPFGDLERPALRVGAVLDGAGFDPNRTARDHLRILAAYSGVPVGRVAAVLDDVSLSDDADRKVGGFSLGMRRRLALASAFLGEPELLVLDEPTNGLDPAGIRWLREKLRSFAARGGTVLVSSHVIAEVAQTADDVVVINHGRVVAERSVASITAEAVVVVRTPERDRLAEVVQRPGTVITPVGGDGLEIVGATQEAVGRAAASVGVPLFELTGRHQNLEEVFFTLTEQEA